VECDAALLVNPYDPESVALALDRALSMPLEERRARHGELYKVLAANDIRFWGERFISALTHAATETRWPRRRAAALSESVTMS
jgi:trehalose 6-phosphate synthase